MLDDMPLCADFGDMVTPIAHAVRRLFGTWRQPTEFPCTVTLDASSVLRSFYEHEVCAAFNLELGAKAVVLESATLTFESSPDDSAAHSNPFEGLLELNLCLNSEKCKVAVGYIPVPTGQFLSGDLRRNTAKFLLGEKYRTIGTRESAQANYPYVRCVPASARKLIHFKSYALTGRAIDIVATSDSQVTLRHVGMAESLSLDMYCARFVCASSFDSLVDCARLMHVFRGNSQVLDLIYDAANSPPGSDSRTQLQNRVVECVREQLQLLCEWLERMHRSVDMLEPCNANDYALKVFTMIDQVVLNYYAKLFYRALAASRLREMNGIVCREALTGVLAIQSQGLQRSLKIGRTFYQQGDTWSKKNLTYLPDTDNVFAAHADEYNCFPVHDQRSARQRYIRSVPPDSLGLIDPINTPDGCNIGMKRALCARVTISSTRPHWQVRKVRDAVVAAIGKFQAEQQQTTTTTSNSILRTLVFNYVPCGVCRVACPQSVLDTLVATVRPDLAVQWDEFAITVTWGVAGIPQVSLPSALLHDDTRFAQWKDAASVCVAHRTIHSDTSNLLIRALARIAPFSPITLLARPLNNETSRAGLGVQHLKQAVTSDSSAFIRNSEHKHFLDDDYANETSAATGLTGVPKFSIDLVCGSLLHPLVQEDGIVLSESAAAKFTTVHEKTLPLVALDERRRKQQFQQQRLVLTPFVGAWWDANKATVCLRSRKLFFAAARQVSNRVDVDAKTGLASLKLGVVYAERETLLYAWKVVIANGKVRTVSLVPLREAPSVVEGFWLKRIDLLQNGGSRLKARLVLERTLRVAPGDKFSTCSGNKGVVRLLPDAEMPAIVDACMQSAEGAFCHNGKWYNVARRLEAIVSPCTLIKRQNVGGLIDDQQQRGLLQALVFDTRLSIFYGEMLAAGDSPNPVELSRTGFLFLSRHCAVDRISLRKPNAENVHPFTKQPVQGRQRGGGTKMGEMESRSKIADGLLPLLTRIHHVDGRMARLDQCRRCGEFVHAALHQLHQLRQCTGNNEGRQSDCFGDLAHSVNVKYMAFACVGASLMAAGKQLRFK